MWVPRMAKSPNPIAIAQLEIYILLDRYDVFPIERKIPKPKPKKVAETPKVDAEKLELDEAIETLNLLLETLPKEEHKEIKEAIEILEMLK